MPEALTFPIILYHPTEPSRIFESQEEYAAAGPGWVLTPTEAAEAAAMAQEAPPEAEAEADLEPRHPRRSTR